MICDEDNFLWCEKYRPKKVSECILPSNLTDIFQNYVNVGNIQHLLLAGSPGQGKTTIARALCEELGADYIIINGSLDGNIDTLRTTISQFASCVSFTGGRKYIILDEADGLTKAIQDGLRNFMEEFSSNAGFILTCNHTAKISEAIRSRCTTIDFRVAKSEWQKLMSAFMSRVVNILQNENVQFEKKAIAEVIKKNFPDWRKTLNELQKYAMVSGNIDTGILAQVDEEAFRILMGIMKDKNFPNMRKWVATNLDGDACGFFRKLYDSSSDYLVQSSIPQLVLLLAKYQDMASRVADLEINTVALLTECMVDLEYK